MEEEKHSLNNYPNPRSKKPWWKDEKAVAIAILSVLVLALVVAIITKDTTDDNNDDPPTPASGKMKAQVMPVQWVKKAIDYKYHSGPKPNNYDEKRDLVIFETQRGNATYLEGHIPHSVHSDADLYENGYPTNFLLPDDKLAENAGSLGVCKKCTTIIYSSNPVYASRLWFILSYIGVEDVRVMNGSFSVWVDEGYPVEETVRNLTSTSFKASFHKNVLLSTSDVEKVFSTNLVQMVDVRSLEEYEGKSSGSSRLLEKGRIPFAAWGSQANAGTYTQPNGILHPPSVILDYWHAGSINTKSVPLYIYCASGYRASLAFMYASMMDVPAAMYSDGWWGWSTNWVRNSSYDEPPTPGWEQQPSGRDVYPGIKVTNMLAASLLLTAVLGSLKIWEDEASSGVDKKEFTISSAGASVAEVNKDMQGKRSMDKNGMLRVDGVLDKKECETMLGKVEEIKPRQTKGNHHYNLPVVMDEAVQKICVTIIDKLYRTIKDTLGPDALLVAMGIMVNDPGAKYQKWHADTIPEKDVAKLYTYFVALEDVEDLMGPTGLVTGSHKGEWLSQCEKEITAAKRAPCSKLIDSSAKVSATLSQGDILIMDSTTQHRANANLSKKRRRLFYFSLTGPGRLPDGSTYTLHKGYKSAKLTLRNYRNWHKTDPALPNGNKRFVGYESGEM